MKKPELKNRNLQRNHEKIADDMVKINVTDIATKETKIKNSKNVITHNIKSSNGKHEFIHYNSENTKSHHG